MFRHCAIATTLRHVQTRSYPNASLLEASQHPPVRPGIYGARGIAGPTYRNLRGSSSCLLHRAPREHSALFSRPSFVPRADIQILGGELIKRNPPLMAKEPLVQQGMMRRFEANLRQFSMTRRCGEECWNHPDIDVRRLPFPSLSCTLKLWPVGRSPITRPLSRGPAPPRIDSGVPPGRVDLRSCGGGAFAVFSGDNTPKALKRH